MFVRVRDPIQTDGVWTKVLRVSADSVDKELDDSSPEQDADECRELHDGMRLLTGYEDHRQIHDHDPQHDGANSSPSHHTPSRMNRRRRFRRDRVGSCARILELAAPWAAPRGRRAPLRGPRSLARQLATRIPRGLTSSWETAGLAENAGSRRSPASSPFARASPLDKGWREEETRATVRPKGERLGRSAANFRALVAPDTVSRCVSVWRTAGWNDSDASSSDAPRKGDSL